MLELKKVSKIYKTKAGDVGALNGVSLTFPTTGLVFITGKSGCGKTTMLNVIGGLDGIDSGEISLFGKSFSSFSQGDYDNYRNTFIGFIFQEYNLLSEFTVQKNIEIAMELQGRACNQEELDNLLREMEIEHLKDRKPMELSGGQRQRVAIARALVKNPRIIMADEPTGALDSGTGIQVLDILKKLSKDKLIIVVSHDREFAEKYADRIVHLVDGVVESDVTISESEVASNVCEGQNSVMVKAGADLSDDEKDTLAKAVKESKKIELISNLSHRSVSPTGEIKTVKNSDGVKLKKSKMKLKSSVNLGLKSLMVKPLRLAFTIFLSVMAFAVFGLFDTVANFNTGDIINSLLRTSTSTVAMYGEYVIPGEKIDSYNVKLSDESLSEISRSTGLKVKGVYNLKSNTSGTVAETLNIGETLKYNVSGGEKYYTKVVNGFVEFGEDEFSADGKTIKDFGYKLVDGRYPKISYYWEEDVMYVDPDSLMEVAISTFIADSIVHYLDGNYLNGKQILSPSDLIGETISVSTQKYKVVGIIDCGKIPEKYDVLKTKSSGSEVQALANEFSLYINSSANRCLFFAKGRMEQKMHMDVRPTIYYSGNFLWKVTTSWLNATKDADKFVYSSKGVDKDNVIFFDNNTSSNPTIDLKDDEILVHPSNFKLMFLSELNALSLDDNLWGKANALVSKIIANEMDNVAMKSAMDEFFKLANVTTKALKEKTVTLSKESMVNDGRISKEFKVVGVYYDYDHENSMASKDRFRVMMNENALNDYKIYSKQGEYSRFIVNPSGNLFGSNVLSSYMLSKDGLSLNWFENHSLKLIQDNEKVVRQGADLFLYISLALAVFSIFMLFNYIVISIVNKKPTIGVLRGLGSGGRDILRIFLSESLMIGLINGVMASIVTAIGCTLVNLYISTVMGIGIPFALFTIRQVLIIFGMSIGTAIFSSTLPIINIARKKPVDLIRTI